MSKHKLVMTAIEKIASMASAFKKGCLNVGFSDIQNPSRLLIVVSASNTLY